MMNRGSSTTSSNKQRTTFKIVVMGQKGVGKTSLLMRYDKGVFCKTYAVTIGVESYKKQLVIDSQPVHLQMWDTAGHEGFKSIIKSFYSQICCSIIVYSDPQRLKTNLQAYLRSISESAPENIAIAVVRSKIDAQPLREDQKSMLEEMVKLGQIILWMPVSAKQGTNVDQLFQSLATAMHLKLEDNYEFRQLVYPRKSQSICLSKGSLIEMDAKRKYQCC